MFTPLFFGHGEFTPRAIALRTERQVWPQGDNPPYHQLVFWDISGIVWMKPSSVFVIAHVTGKLLF